MTNSALPVLLLAALALGAAGSALAADPGKPPAPQARVAGGGTVPLVRSARTPEQWSAERPQYRDLRPKARSNVE